MNPQSYPPPGQQLAAGQALHLGRLGGELSVIEGRVWLTRDGDLGDHVVEAGERIRLAIDDNAVIEAVHAGEVIRLHWNPRRQSLVGAVLVEPLRGIAYLAGLAASGFAVLARHAREHACRAQGRIASS